MNDLRLSVKKRAFPSHGRMRLNLVHLPGLEIKEGENVDLVNETTTKSVTVTVIADAMVPEGHIRVSEEDLKTIGLDDNNKVLIRRTTPLVEKIKNATSKTAKDVKKTVKKATGSRDEL